MTFEQKQISEQQQLFDVPELSSGGYDQYTDEHRHIDELVQTGEVGVLAGLAHSAVEAARSSEGTADKRSKDQLTGFYNRQMLTEAINNRLAEMREGGHTYGLGVIFIDLRHLKQVNDSQAIFDDGGDITGHETEKLGGYTRCGDLYIQTVAQAIRDSQRQYPRRSDSQIPRTSQQTDEVPRDESFRLDEFTQLSADYRVGGDEFVVLLNLDGIEDEDQATTILNGVVERYRAKINERVSEMFIKRVEEFQAQVVRNLPFISNRVKEGFLLGLEKEIKYWRRFNQRFVEAFNPGVSVGTAVLLKPNKTAKELIGEASDRQQEAKHKQEKEAS